MRANYVSLNNYSILKIYGRDSINFLNRQLTQDMNGLVREEKVAKLAAYCNSRGRLISTMIIWHEFIHNQDTFFAILPEDISYVTQNTLSNFILRDQVKISHLEQTQYNLIGIICNQSDVDKLNSLAGGILPTEQMGKIKLPTGTWIASNKIKIKTNLLEFYHAEKVRWWLISELPIHKLENILNIELVNTSTWSIYEKLSEIAWLSSKTQEIFIPTSLNLDRLSYINFNKGCFPGQEVIAKLYYRKKIKYRMSCGILINTSLSSNDVIAQDLYIDSSSLPCGRVIDAEKEANNLVILFEFDVNETTIPKKVKGELIHQIYFPK